MEESTWEGVRREAGAAAWDPLLRGGVLFLMQELGAHLPATGIHFPKEEAWGSGD